MKQQKINHLAVWISVIAFQILFFFWYSPTLFAARWMNYLGKNNNSFDSASINRGLLFSFLGAIAFNYFLAWLFKKLEINNGAKGFAMAFVIALCCFALQTFTQDSFSMPPNGLSWINSGNIFLNFCVARLLLGSWKKYQIN